MADTTSERETTRSPPVNSGPSSPAKSPAKSLPPGTQDPSSPTGILPAEHWAQEPVPEDDAESTIGESAQLSTASVTSSILNYRTLNGRRYHSDVGNASYWGSNDEKQNEAMDINHHSLTLQLDDKLHLAPLDREKAHKVLDIATGTGFWAIDFADEYPEVEVIGTDISPIQPTWIPPNLRFEIEDCTRQWTFTPESFDYIHMRWLVGSIADWHALFVEAYKACKPGGWVESYETAATIESDHTDIPASAALSQWSYFCIEGGRKIGRTFTVVEDGLQRKGMEAAGFVDIQEKIVKRPVGSWPKDPVFKEIGSLVQLTLQEDAEGYILFLANTLGWSRDEVRVYLAHHRQEVRSGKYCPYYRQRIIWGRRPE